MLKGGEYLIDKVKKRDIGSFFDNSHRLLAMNELYLFVIIM